MSVQKIWSHIPATSSLNCTQDTSQVFLYFPLSIFILSTPHLWFYSLMGPMSPPLLTELPLYSGQPSWEWEVIPCPPGKPIHSARYALSQVLVGCGSATGPVWSSNQVEKPAQRRWEANLRRGSWEDVSFLSRFLSQVNIYSKRTKSLFSLFRDGCIPRGHTGTQNLAVKRTEWRYSVKMGWLPRWQPFCNLEEGPRERKTHWREAPTLWSLSTNAY